MDQTLSEKYRAHCRPMTGAILQAIGLDKVYRRGFMDHLFHEDAEGREVQVTDFLGGYGASLFGHNNPRLVSVLEQCLREQVVFNGQASARGAAGLLGEKLDAMLFARTGRHFVTTLASTGAEAVEAAMKHAELVQRRRIDALHRELEALTIRVGRRLRAGKATLAEDFLPEARARLELPADVDFCAVAAAVFAFNRASLQRPPRFLCARRAFHGKTTGAVQLTHHEEYRLPFERIGPQVVFVDPAEPAALEQAVEESRVPLLWFEVDAGGGVRLAERSRANVSACFLEPIQGEGGIRPLPADFAQRCRALCDEHGFHLVFDEIQSGMGRTGTFLASERLGVVGDYYLLSKSLGGGLSKISALAVHSAAYEEEFGFIHTSTFAEDDPSARLGLATLALLEEDPGLLENCRARGAQLREGLTAIQRDFPDVIAAVRGEGLMLGFELAPQENLGSPTLTTASRQGMLGYVVAGYLLHEHRIRVAPTLSSTTTIRLEPSAYVGADECDRLLGAVRRLCQVIYAQNVHSLMRFVVGAQQPGSQEEIRSFRTDRPQRGAPEAARKVAFIGHFIGADDMSLWDPGFALFTAAQRRRFLDALHELIGVDVAPPRLVRSVEGEAVEFHPLGIFIDSRLIGRAMAKRDLSVLRAKVDEAVEHAIALGCSVVGFGGFTSIVTGNCEAVLTDRIALTSGNSLTVAMGVEAIEKAAVEAAIDLDGATVAVLGATGNIASVYAELISERARRVILVGRPGREGRLREVAARILLGALRAIRAARSPGAPPEPRWWDAERPGGVAAQIAETRAVASLLDEADDEGTGLKLLSRLVEELGDSAPVAVATDVACLREARLLVCASNSPTPVVKPEHLGPGRVVICDIATPMDTDPAVARERPDVTVFQGGVVRLGANEGFDFPGMPLDKGLSFACMAETLTLGLAGIAEDYSVGQISKRQVLEIRGLAARQGFTLARLKTERSF